MSMVPIATERSPWPPGFSLLNMVSQILVRIEVLAARVEQRLGSASSRRGRKRSRISLPWP
jgi:hypothetical protein